MDLKKQIDRSDSSSPNFVSVNAAGEVTAEFEGKIVALGLVLHEAHEIEEVINVIEWIDSNGSANEFISGWLELGSNLHLLQLQSTPPAKGGFTAVTIASPDNALTPQDYRVSVTAKTLKALILDAEGRSNFLQLLTANNRKINFGQSEAEWPGAVNASNIVTIAHGLGVAPKTIIVTPKLGGAFSTSQGGLVNIEVQLQNPFGFPAAGTKIGFSWIAIG